MAEPVSQSTLVNQLTALGVVPGGILVVHTAFSKIAPVEGGPIGLIAALQAVLGAAGTLVMPSMSDDDAHPFDVGTTPCAGMGIVAETFWRQPGVQRSDSPHALAASGPHAAAITAPHPWQVPHGLDSPVGRACALDAQVLLLGVGHDANTTIHLAEALGGVRYGCQKSLTLLEDGQPTRVEYFETDHCCERFSLLDAWLDAAALQRHGWVGHGTARLVRARDVITVTLPRLAADEAVFLHPAGTDPECDVARRSLDPTTHSHCTQYPVAQRTICRQRLASYHW